MKTKLGTHTHGDGQTEAHMQKHREIKAHINTQSQIKRHQETDTKTVRPMGTERKRDKNTHKHTKSETKAHRDIQIDEETNIHSAGDENTHAQKLSQIHGTQKQANRRSGIEARREIREINTKTHSQTHQHTKPDEETSKQNLSHKIIVGERQKMQTKGQSQTHKHTMTRTETCKHTLRHTSTVGETQYNHIGRHRKILSVKQVQWKRYIRQTQNKKSDTQTHKVWQRDMQTGSQSKTNKLTSTVLETYKLSLIHKARQERENNTQKP